MFRRDFLRQSLLAGVGASILSLDGDAMAAKEPKPAVSLSPTPPWGLETLLPVKPNDVRYRIAVLTDPHYCLNAQKFDFKALPYSPWIVQQHFLMLHNIERLTGRKVDVLLMPGDLTRDSEPENHKAILSLLQKAPFPSLVIPGNHDVSKTNMKHKHWGLDQFVAAYQGRHGGYQGKAPYYAREILPGLVVIGLNSADTPDGSLRSTWNGRFDEAQLRWFKDTLSKIGKKKLVMVQSHHCIIPHHPSEKESSKSDWKNFHADNGEEVVAMMHRYGASIAITGHHHINNISRHASLPVTEITTAGACSYPANFRILDVSQDGKKLTVHTISLPWASVLKRIADAARKDTWWKLPEKPHDREAILRFLAGGPEDRHTVIPIR